MTLYLMKPVVWNTRGYTRPSGVKVNSGHPKDQGYGYEEWNNSARLTTEIAGRRLRYFHTEGFGATPLQDHAGEIVIFMYASHDGVQELVGVAGRAVPLSPLERRAAAQHLGLADLADDVWDLPSARKPYDGRKASFRAYWSKTLKWMPAWRCPDDHYLWLERPARLDPMALRGTGKLLTMFNSYTEIDEATALRVMDAVPVESRDRAWRMLHRSMGGGTEDAEADLLHDVDQINRDPAMSPTTRLQLVEARLGQGSYRDALDKRWGGRCAVTACDVRAALRASHIKSWKRSSNAERLEPANGLLLVATLDALFDRGLISFGDDGTMWVSKTLTRKHRETLGVPRVLRRKPDARERIFLADHRHHCFVP